MKIKLLINVLEKFIFKKNQDSVLFFISRHNPRYHMRIAVKLAYDGRKYYGYARQPHLKTVEGEILNALINNNYITNPKEGKLRSASRTDKGVSALCNIITFTTDKKIDSLLQDLSDHSPSLIAYGLTNVDEDFNPRYAHLRHYRYYLPLEGLNMDEMLSTAALFTGTHNFTNFARIESMKNPVRTIENILFTANSSHLSIDFFAQTFLWHQIRRIIAALLKVNQEKHTIIELKDALDNPSTKIDFGLAPAEPLVLQQLWYKVEFEQDPNKVRAVHQLEHRLIRSLDIRPRESPEGKNEKRNDPQY